MISCWVSWSLKVIEASEWFSNTIYEARVRNLIFLLRSMVRFFMIVKFF
jgi:hypothetical protein